jgi:hypothetical protein
MRRMPGANAAVIDQMNAHKQGILCSLYNAVNAEEDRLQTHDAPQVLPWSPPQRIEERRCSVVYARASLLPREIAPHHPPHEKSQLLQIVFPPRLALTSRARVHQTSTLRTPLVQIVCSLQTARACSMHHRVVTHLIDTLTRRPSEFLRAIMQLVHHSCSEPIWMSLADRWDPS